MRTFEGNSMVYDLMNSSDSPIRQEYEIKYIPWAVCFTDEDAVPVASFRFMWQEGEKPTEGNLMKRFRYWIENFAIEIYEL